MQSEADQQTTQAGLFRIQNNLFLFHLNLKPNSVESGEP